MCYFQQCCVYGKNRQTVTCSTVKVLYCLRVCVLVFAFECFAVSNVVFVEGTYRQCNVSRLVLYSVRVCKLVLRVGCVNFSNVFFGRSAV